VEPGPGLARYDGMTGIFWFDPKKGAKTGGV
jgi:hypothetical protein